MRKVVSNMKLQKLEFYQPSDLVKLLNESGATLKEVANATGIPYATLSNYRYGKTDSDSMPHRVVVELSNFFRSQQRMVVDVRLQQAIGLPEFYDNLNEIKDMFKYSDEVLEMYVLHEMLYRYYNLDSIDKFDDILLFVSRNLSSFLMKYDVVYLGMIDDLQSKGCHFIFEYNEPSLPCVTYDVSHDAKILIPDDFNFIGNNKLKPLSATLHNKNLIFDYFVENVLFLKVNKLKYLYFKYHPQLLNISESFLSTDFSVLNSVSHDLDLSMGNFSIVQSDISLIEHVYGKSYNDWLWLKPIFLKKSTNDNVINRLKQMSKKSDAVRQSLAAMQKNLLSYGVYVELLIGNYETLFDNQLMYLYLQPGNLCNPEKALDLNFNKRLSVITNNISVKYKNDVSPSVYIRPVDFDWELFCKEKKVKKNQPIEIELKKVADLDVIVRICYFDKYYKRHKYDF